MMLLTPKSNLERQNSPNCSPRIKPLILKEVLQLRDGLGLPREVLQGYIPQKTHPKLQFNGWAVFSLN